MMAGKVWMIAQIVLIFFVLDGIIGLAMAPNAPGPATPTGLRVTLDKLSLKPGILAASAYVDYVTTTTAVDVIATSSTDPSASTFGTGSVPVATYKSVKVVLDGMGTYQGTNPCTGEPIDLNDPQATAIIELPQMVATSEDGQNKVILKYQEPHPINGLPAGVQLITGFRVAGPTEFRLIFPASNSVICAADVPPLRTIPGTFINSNPAVNPNGVALDPSKGWMLVTASAYAEPTDSVKAYDSTGTESTVRASISGSNTGLSNPFGIYVDATDNEIGVANTGNNSVTIYDNSPAAIWGNATPLHIILGPDTGLSQPTGIASYADLGNSIIVVANAGNNSVTFYSRDDVINGTGDVLPLHTIKGSKTGLRFPCGLYVDTSRNEIGVANNGNDSVTIYDLSMSLDGNISPVRTIQGQDTGLAAPCGLYVDTSHEEIGVVNNVSSTVTFYPLTAEGNVASTRTLRGYATGLDRPSGIYLDMDTDQIVVANYANDSITTYHRVEPDPNDPDRTEPSVQLAGLPALHISAEQQQLLAQYIYTGQLDKQSGAPAVAPPEGVDCNGDGTPDILEGAPVVCFDGYRFDWRITDSQIRQLGDATALAVLPPDNTNFTFTNGTIHSVLTPDCPVLTPFIILDLFTNCPPAPYIGTPLPPPSGIYAIPAVVLQETLLNNKLPFATTALAPSQFPQPIPTLSLALDQDTITSIAWSYASLPLIVSQQLRINLTQSIQDYSSCNYQEVAGNSPTLVYNSGRLAPDIRDLSDITNNRCEIRLSDIATITFTVTDALANNFIFTWNPT
jgi:hypothetical protein